MIKAASLRATTLRRQAMLLVLTWAAGCVDAISYLGLGHVFTAMMTGNIVLLGLALAQGDVLAALRSVFAVIGFSVGVFIGAMIAERESKIAEWPGVVTLALAAETGMLAIFTATWHLVGAIPGAGVRYFLIVLLAFAMGIQSAAVRRLGVPGIATTYITGTLTSLMVDLLGWLRSLAAPLPVANSTEASSTGRSQAIPWDQRVVLLASVVGLYCFGALAGGFVVARWPVLASVLPLCALTLVVVNAVLRYRYRRVRWF